MTLGMRWAGPWIAIAGLVFASCHTKGPGGDLGVGAGRTLARAAAADPGPSRHPGERGEEIGRGTPPPPVEAREATKKNPLPGRTPDMDTSRVLALPREVPEDKNLPIPRCFPREEDAPPDEPWVGQGERYHPSLPGCDRGSVSVGTVTDGYLVRGARLPDPCPHCRVLARQGNRGLVWSTDELIAGLVRAAARVARRYPGSTLYLGNLSARHGGDIPWSVSHNSGRDADIAYYMVDSRGHQVDPGDLPHLGDQGRCRAPDGTVWRLDAARTWEAVRSLLEDPGFTVQFLFVYRPLERLILAHARRAHAPRDLIARAARVMIQPGISRHDDHIHLRIHCTAGDLAEGCRETGPHREGAADPKEVVSRRVQEVLPLLRARSPDTRYQAAYLLGLLGDAAARAGLGRLVRDREPSVRFAAIQALAQVGLGSVAMAVAKQAERDPYPAVVLRAIETLAAARGVGAQAALARLALDLRELAWADATAELASGFLPAARVPAGHPSSGPRIQVGPLSLPGPGFVVRAVAASALEGAWHPDAVQALLRLLSDPDPIPRLVARRSLAVSFNRDLGDDPEAWRDWYQAHRREGRTRWRGSGFRAAGLPIPDRPGLAHVPALLFAVSLDHHLSQNARLELARILRRAHPDHLTWSRWDARWFWTNRYRARLRREAARRARRRRKR